jgi:TM2 domain-containing membrane protein YozV
LIRLDHRLHTWYTEEVMKRKSTAYFWWSFSLIGLAGLHRCYLGKWTTGFIWFLTFGLFGIGSIYDFLALPSLVRQARLKLYPRNRTPVYVFAPTYSTSNRTVNNYYAPAPAVRLRKRCSYCSATADQDAGSCSRCAAPF